MDAGFLTVVEIGQYFLTKDTAEFLTIHRCSGLSWVHSAKRWRSIATKRMDQGNTQIGLVLEIATCWLHDKCWDQNYVVEQRQFSHLGQIFSWIKQVCAEFEQQWADNSRSSARRICVEIWCERFCTSKAKAKPQRREPADSSPRTIAIGKRTWTDVEPREYSLSYFACWNRVMWLHSGHITSWYSKHDSDISLFTQTSWAQVGFKKKKFSFCTAHFALFLCRLPRLHGSGAGILGIRTLIYSWNWDIEWRWHLLWRSRCWDVNLMSSRHRWLKCVNSHSALRWTQQCRDSQKPWEQWDSRSRNLAERTWESESQRRMHLGKTLKTGILNFTDMRAHSILPILPCWKQQDNHPQW